jgi:hypothetical protein
MGPVGNTKINSVVQLSPPLAVCWAGQSLFPPGPVLSSPGTAWAVVGACKGKWTSTGWSQRARQVWLWAVPGLWQCQGMASSWGGPGVPHMGQSRHWLKLDEAGASALPFTCRSPGPWAEVSTQQALRSHDLGDQAEGALTCPTHCKLQGLEPSLWNSPVLFHSAGLLCPTVTASTSTLFLNFFLSQFYVQCVACF